jgi:CHAD domain-containing protein
VRLATFDGLFPDSCPQSLARFRSLLAADRDAGAPAPAAAQGLLGEVRGRVALWRLKGRDEDILRAGLSQTRLRARFAMDHARGSRDIEAMHDWRKRAKDYWYQSRLLLPVWPEPMQTFVTAAERLTEDLGHHHDLAVLAAHADGLPDASLGATARVLLATRVAAAQAMIEDRAFPLGQRLFAGDPDAMARLWVRWWKIWRS